MAQAVDEKQSNEIPATMSAVLCEKAGDPKDVCKLKTDVPVPKIAEPNQLLVKVFYAAINPIDYKLVTGVVPMGLKHPYGVGADFAGRVVAKGDSDETKEYEVGSLVYGQCWVTGQGSFAEYCLVKAASVDLMPKDMDALNAAAVPLVSNTSYQALEATKIKAGEKLLILGGSTATGLAAIQIAKNLIGCGEVIVTSSQEDLCKSVGADRVINYRKEKWEDVLKGANVDAVYDCVGGKQSWEDCIKCEVLKKDGYFISIVSSIPDANKDDIGQKHQFLFQNPTKGFKDTSKLVKDGKLKPILDPESPFEFKDWDKVFAKSMAHKAKGKLVVKIAEK